MLFNDGRIKGWYVFDYRCTKDFVYYRHLNEEKGAEKYLQMKWKGNTVYK